MASYEKIRSNGAWISSRPVKILLLIFLLGPPFLLICIETIVEQQGRELTSTILDKLSFDSLSNTTSSNETSTTSSTSSSNVTTKNNVSSEDDCPCHSRCEQDSLRRPSRIHSLPPALSTALAAYERMHSSCYHSRDLSKAIQAPDPNDPCRYLVFLQDGKFGLGNHILSLLSAFVYSLLTNRMLLVDTRNHIPELFCEPFRNSSWLLPPDFPYDRLLLAPMLADGLKQKFSYGSTVHLMLLSQQTPQEQLFFCPDTQTRLEKVRWIGWSSNQYYVPRFFTFPRFWRPLVSLFPDVSLIFTHLSRYLILPQNPVWEKIRRYHFAYSSLVPGKAVGVQIRRRENAEFHEPTYRRTMQCLVENGLVPSVSESGHDIPADKGQHQSRKNRTKVFVTSLQSRYYEELRNTYINKPTVDGSLVRVHTMSHDEVESQSYEQVRNALAEMWLLSLSDELVTSSWSTFGYVAQGLGALRPYILNIKGDFGKDGLPACSLGQSIEPCNQFPFSSVCERNETADLEHSEWIKAHIRRCQDEPSGIQLIQD
ncbi:fucosyltransferase CAZy family GT37-like protein [Selaginella moellendorffii]|uniref:Fucosyltransferase n=2 Tax=Selaginella moellendorffii TaxID=88036 RepID=D8RMZ4_SELML|nr:fucosyltransferase CAZy family GT37-like protein [Selaginella moellendorffii]